MAENNPRRADTRTSIVQVAARLLRDHGPGALTTRGVAEAAGVQAPAIYRIFGDKDGLLEAVAEHVMATYVAAKAERVDAAAADNVDPLDDLRDGWHAQIAFALANPAIFGLLSDPQRVRDSAAARAGRDVLVARMHRVAEIGRLRVSEQHAVDLMQAAGIGVAQTLLSKAPARREDMLADAMYDAVLGQIVTGAGERPDDELLSAAVTLRAVLDRAESLSEAERRLMSEWLGRVVESRSGGNRDIHLA